MKAHLCLALWLFSPAITSQAQNAQRKQLSTDTEAAPEWALNYHLMHRGGESMPGDPNAALLSGGVYWFGSSSPRMSKHRVLGVGAVAIENHASEC